MENTSFSKELIAAFEAFDVEKADKLNDTIYVIASNALKEHNKHAITAIKDAYKEFKSARERLYNLLLLNQKSELLFLLGEMTTSLCLTYNTLKDAEMVEKATLWLDNSPLSCRILKAIKKRGVVSTPDLAALCEVRSASVSQSIKRIKENYLISCHTIGKTNFYSLTPLGERVLSNKIQKDKEANIYALSLIGEKIMEASCEDLFIEEKLNKTEEE